LKFPITKEDADDLAQGMLELKLNEHLDAKPFMLEEDAIFKRTVFL